MPGFDGTGPRGVGPMTGRGQGYCALVLPSPDTGRNPYGYAGLTGRPVQLRAGGSPAEMAYPGRIPPTLARPLASFFGSRGFGRRRGRGRGRRR